MSTRTILPESVSESVSETVSKTVPESLRERVSIAEPAFATAPAVPANDELITRLAARISSARDEIAPFASVPQAIDVFTERFFRNRRVVIARPTREELGVRAWRASRTAKEVAWLGARGESRRDPQALASFDALVAAARDADTLVLSSPFVRDGRSAGALAARDLLLLRARAPRPVIVLDLLDEELARAPLTQPAMLLPGTVILRGFGRFWREAGARAVADIAFAAGPAELIAPLRNAGPDEAQASEAVWDLDRVGIDRAVESRAAAARSADACA